MTLSFTVSEMGKYYRILSRLGIGSVMFLKDHYDCCIMNKNGQVRDGLGVSCNNLKRDNSALNRIVA